MTYCSGTPHKDFCSSKAKFSTWDGQVSNEVGNTFNWRSLPVRPSVQWKHLVAWEELLVW